MLPGEKLRDLDNGYREVTGKQSRSGTLEYAWTCPKCELPSLVTSLSEKPDKIHDEKIKHVSSTQGNIRLDRKSQYRIGHM